MALVAALLVAALSLAFPSKAPAALHNPVPADASGDPTESFFDNQSLWAYVTSDLAGGRICVVPDRGPDVLGSCKAPAAAMGGGRTVAASIGTVYTLIKREPLPRGIYRLLVENSEGTPLETSVPFHVSVCEGCPQHPDAAIVQAFKSAATAYQHRMDGMCELHGVLEHYAGKAIGMRGIKKDINVGVTARLTVSTPRFALTLSGSVFVTFTVIDPASLNITKALDIMKEVACGAERMYREMAADPPDPNFSEVTPPRPLDIDPLSPESLDTAVRSIDRERALVEATRHAFERYQGAEAADDQVAQVVQLRAAGEFASDLSNELGRSAEALRAWADDAAADPALAGTILSSSDAPGLAALYQRVHDSGFTPEEIEQFHAVGYSDADIAEIRTHASVGLDRIPLDTTYPQALRDVATALESEAETVADFASDMYAVAARIETANGLLAAGDDTLATPEDIPGTVDVTANDVGAGGLTLVDHTSGSQGSVLCTTAGSCTYHPNFDFHGSDSFTYTVEDGEGRRATATVSVTVTEVNDEPRLGSDTLELPPGVPSGLIDVLANDTPGPANEAAQGLTFERITHAPAHGTAELITTGPDAGKIRYTPDPGFGGTDFFFYEACDDGATGGAADPRCAVGDASVRVRSNPPVAHDDELTTDEDVPVTHDIVANDTDPDGDELVIDFTSRFPEAEHGFVRCDDGVSCTYTPDPEFSGQDGWTYRVADTAGETDEAQVTVTVRAVNDPPRVKDERFATPRDTPGELDVLVNDHEVEGSPLRVTGATDGAHGTSSCSEAGRCTYTPEAGYTGSDTFTYTVSDDEGATTQGSVSVVVMLAAQPSGVLDSKGTDFWLAFPSNFGFGDLSFFLTGDRSTSATVEAPATSPPFTRDVVVNQGDVTTVPVPNDAQLRDLIGESIQPDRAVRIRSEREITAYGLNYISATTDAYLGLPTDVLGTDYLALGWRNGTPRFGWHVSELAVVATQDGTAITVQQPGGEPRNAQLDAGDVFTLNLAEDGDDISGTSVSATKPVAVFSGNLCANIPTDVGFCDHVVEQMPPTSTWGTRFVTAPLATRTKGDHFRILASADDTTVTIDGEEVAQLDRGQLHEQLIEGPASIVADGPVLVAQFSNGSGFDDCPESRCDPFMMLIPPYEQFLSSYTVTTPASGYRDNFINVVVPQAGVLGVRLDGQPVPASSFSAVGTSGFAYAQLPVATGTHVVEGTRPFGAFMYGFDFFDSYGYPGGLSLAPIAQVEDVGLTPATAEHEVDTEGCVTATVTDASGTGLPDIRVDFEVTGANPQTAFATTDAAGEARYCYTGERAGEDTIRAAVGAIAATATVSWTGDPPNRPPTATDLSVETDEDRAVDITLVGSDPDGDSLTFAVASVPAHGTLSGSGAALIYVPSINYNGPDSFAFSVSDGKGGADAGTVSISVKPVNDPPVASDDEVTTDEDTPVTVQAAALVANDLDADGDALSLTAVSDAEHGTVELVGGAVTFTPAPDYHGPASFRYSVSDGNGGTASAGVAVTVRSVNDRPSATDVSVQTDEDTPVEITLEGSDPDGDTLTFQIVSQPAHGAVSGSGASRTYTPAANYHGPDLFRYVVSDGALTSAPATVAITVLPVQDAPSAADRAVETEEDTAVDITLAGSDPDGDTLTFAVAAGPAHGTLSGSGASRTYTPDAEYHGLDSFTYSVSDGNGGSDTATVSITVTPVNDAPVAGDDEAATDEDTPVAIQAADLLANDVDVDGDTLAITSVSDAEHGMVELTGGVVTFTPAPDYHGPASFRYGVSDGNGGSASARVGVTVLPVNDRPRATDLSIRTDEETAVDITIEGSDPDGDELTFAIVTQPAHGSLSGAGASRTYTPDAGYDGPDSFTYTVSDGALTSASATVTITVRPVGDAPTADDGAATTLEDTPVDITLEGSDADDDPLSFEIVSGPEHGALSGSGASRTYSPGANYHGPDSFTFRVSDGTADSNVATVSITVTPVNDSPVARDDEASTDEDTPVAIQAADVRANDSDVDGDSLTVTAVSDAQNGNAELAGGVVTFTPAPDFHGAASFRYGVSDGNGGSASARVAVTVRSVNDPPRAQDGSLEVDADAAKELTLGASDVDGDSLTFTIVAGPAHGTLSGSGATRTYTPDPGYDGPDSFTFRVSDGQADSNVAAVSITVRPVQPAAMALVIDEGSIDNGKPPNFFSAAAVNDRIARVGLRTTLPAFTGSNVGRKLVLHTGEVGSEGWLAIKTIPASWATAGPTNDGLLNFFLAGPGLGSGRNRERLLDNVPDVTPLRATGLGELVGRRVCAVVYDGDVSVNYGPLKGSLKGANLGVVAFKVLNVTRLTGYGSASLPKVELEVLDRESACGSLQRFTGAPALTSSSDPFDVVPFGIG